MRASLPLALILFLFTAACAANGEATQRLVFDSQRDGDADIYTIAADGTGVRQLTDVPGRDYEPDAGPDGKTVVFASQRATGESAQLYLMDIDSETITVYRANPDSSRLKLMAARSFKYDRFLQDYNNDKLTPSKTRSRKT